MYWWLDLMFSNRQEKNDQELRGALAILRYTFASALRF
jgi:hypothetical protein